MARKKRKQAGLPPGSIVFTGHRKVEKINIHYLQYNETALEEQVLDNQSITDFHKPTRQYVQWYDIRGVHDTELIEEFGKVFSVHSLALEDIADTSQRAKMDEYDNGIFVTLKAITFNKSDRKVQFEQVALYLGEDFVLSFQEDADDLFVEIRNRLQKSAGRIRKRSADYLLYALLDTIVDKYFIIFDDLEEILEELEAEISEELNMENKSQIYDLKQEMSAFRKAVTPLRELTSELINSESSLILDTTEVYLRDLKDHVIQTIDLVETYRDNLNSLQDLYLSELSFRMNKVMQVLTIMATIFIPLTFLAGIYGMNFDNIPELHWKYGYFYLLGIMALVVLLMLWYFRRNKWL